MINGSDSCYSSTTFIDGNVTKDHINYLISIDVKAPKKQKDNDLNNTLLEHFHEKFNEKIEDFGLCYMQDRSANFDHLSKQTSIVASGLLKKFVKYGEASKTLYRELMKHKKDSPDIIFQVTIICSCTYINPFSYKTMTKKSIMNFVSIA